MVQINQKHLQIQVYKDMLDSVFIYISIKSKQHKIIKNN